MKHTLVGLALLMSGCQGPSQAPAPGAPGTAPSLAPKMEPFPSTYMAPAAPPTLIRNATVLTGTGVRFDRCDLLLAGGKVAAVGPSIPAPLGATIVEAAGRWVTPGLIDVHSHLGVYPSPGVTAHSDGNEIIDPNTANVWAEHGVWPQDPGFHHALAGGVTTLQVLPGSANLIGGRAVVLKNVPATSYQAMKFPGASHGLKMATGENPKRVYGGLKRAPYTRMGNVAGYRQAFADAQDYLRQRAKYDREMAVYESKRKTDSNALPPVEPKRDLRLETLAGVLEGRIRVHVHSYRSDEMLTMLDLAEEFGFRISAFHHAVEAYKIADELAVAGVGAAMWADWWGFKLEAFDGIQENIVLVDRPRDSLAIVHSDSAEGIQRLNQEAAKAVGRARAMGLEIPPERAIRWITRNPSVVLGLSEQVGTLEPGKMADVVVWSGDPFSVYTRADQVYIDGVLRHDRANPGSAPRSDFMLGMPMTMEATR